jgi:cell fate regulator YaaT (PSP1 superfamily)
MTVFDWLQGVALPSGVTPFDAVEVRFKANRKAFFRKPEGAEVYVGDVVVVEADPGTDVGVVTLTGELVRAQMKARKLREDQDIPKIRRKATPEDIEVWQQARLRENDTVREARRIIQGLRIDMKLADVEYQGDGRKATFYYTAEERIDFRQLVKELAGAFSIRVEMRQIGARQEAARVGGIGVCGRELCCASWLTDFRTVSTSAARYQQLSLNPAKLAGQCGKLKCCLNFELDQYIEGIKDFPSPNAKIKLKEGKAVVFKMDIFKRLVYLLNLDEPGSSPVPVAVEDVQELIEMNTRGEAPASLSEFAIEEEPDEMEEVYADVVGQDSLTRFDEARRKKRKRGGRDRDRGRSPGSGPAPSGAAPSGAAPQRSAPPRPAPPRTDGPRPASSGPAAPRPSEGASGGEGGNRSRRNRNRGRDRRKPGNETPRPDAG